MKPPEFPKGWDERRVSELLAHYETQSEEEAAAEDAQFPRAAVPKVYDALKVENDLTLEVQQTGDGVVRTITMGSTDG